MHWNVLQRSRKWTTEEIGRSSLLKYCLMTILIILFMPSIVGVIFQLFFDDRINVLTFYTNLYKEIIDNLILIAINAMVTGGFIWFAGSTVGHQIIRNKKPTFLVGGLCFLILWLVLFTGTTITDAIVNSTRWGKLGFDSAISGWLRYGFPLFLIYGILHGLTMGYLLGNEVKNKGRENEINDTPLNS